MKTWWTPTYWICLVRYLCFSYWSNKPLPVPTCTYLWKPLNKKNRNCLFWRHATHSFMVFLKRDHPNWGETVWNPGTWYFQLLDTPMSPDPSYLTLGILTYSSRWCHVFDSLSNWDGFIQNLWGRFASTKIPVSSSLSLDFLNYVEIWMDGWTYSWRFSLGFPPGWKNISLVQLDHFPKTIGVNIQKYLKPPPSCFFHNMIR